MATNVANGFVETADKIVIPLISVLATLVLGWHGYNYRRQMDLKLAETRRLAYAQLWEITGTAAPTRLDGRGRDGYLTPDERWQVWQKMTNWYYDDGNGMLLAETSKTVYLNVKHNLVCRTDKLKPRDLAKLMSEQLRRDRESGVAEPEGPGHLERHAGRVDDVLRGILSIKQLSLLRTQLKSDLHIYGQIYSDTLAEHEILFLRHSHVNLRSRAWARASRSHRFPWLRSARNTDTSPWQPEPVFEPGGRQLVPRMSPKAIHTTHGKPARRPSAAIDDPDHGDSDLSVNDEKPE